MLGVSDERWEALERENDSLQRENARLRAERERAQEEAARVTDQLTELHQQLMPLCPCDYNPATTDGPQRECPIHGDGETFVAYVQQLERDRLKAERQFVPLARAARAFIDDPRGVRSDLPTWVTLRHFVEKVDLS